MESRPLEDAELLAQFEARTLPFDVWPHRCHVKVGYLYARDRRFAEALGAMRAGIMAYNETNADRVRTGYHETITVALLRLIAAAALRHGPELTADMFCDSHPELLERELLSRFYSRERLFSESARVSFVEPDRRPLPTMSP